MAYAWGSQSKDHAKRAVEAVSQLIRQGTPVGMVPTERRIPTYIGRKSSAVVEEPKPTNTNMFQLVLEHIGEERNEEGKIIKEGTYYLDLIWNGSEVTKPSPEEHICGAVIYSSTNKYEYVYSSKKQVTEDVTVYLDPYTRDIYYVKQGERVFNQWVLLGHYIVTTHTVRQIYGSGEYKAEEYSGQFKLTACTAGIFVTSGFIALPPSDSDNQHVGTVFVNNISYSVPIYSGGLPEGKSMYYYIRHQISQSVSEGEENSDLSDAEKAELRNSIETCNINIQTCQSNINDYNSVIHNLQDNDIPSLRNNINEVKSEYSDKLVKLWNSYEQEKQVIQTKIDSLQKEDVDYFSKKAELEQDLANLYKNYLEQENNIIKDRDNKIDALNQQIQEDYNTIDTYRGYIQIKQSTINVQTLIINEASLKLYGKIPMSDKCEIVALPYISSATQTDIYLYYYIGRVSVTGDNIVETEQVYHSGSIYIFRIDPICME